MHKVIALIILSLISSISAAAGADVEPRESVFAYECKHSLPQALKCELEPGWPNPQLVLTILENPDKMTEPDREKFFYEYNKIILRYFSFDGKIFIVKANHWEKGTGRYCYRGPNGFSQFCDAVKF